MNWPAHRLSALIFVACLVIGLPGFGIGPPFLPPSWAALSAWVPFANFLYPAAWIVTALIALVGIRRAPALRLACLGTFALFLVWGGVGLVLTALGQPGGNLPGSFANLLAAGAFLALVYLVPVGTRVDRLHAQVAELDELVTNGTTAE